MITTDNKKCFGCKMCADVCPKNAISFEINDNGFWYPRVNEELCVNCNLCEKKCPIDQKTNKNKIRAYAAWSTNYDIRRDSTSGGIYYEFASLILSMDGYICGSVYTDDYKSAYHIISNKKEDLSRIMGSKYFQSDTSKIFLNAKDVLDDGKLLLFTGTPCQIFALKSFLGKEYDNLYTIDFICRGVPSPKLQKYKIELYEKENKSKVIRYRDKSKIKGWSQFGELIEFKNGKKKFISRWDDHINDCFIDKNLNIRESCYLCSYKDGNNLSDITMGDFWGLKKPTEREKKFGVSALITNSEKGEKLLKLVSDKLYYERRSIDEIRSGNPAYVQPAIRPINRDKFYENVEKYGLRKAVKKVEKIGFKKRFSIFKTKFKNRYWPYLTILKKFKYISKFKFLKYNFFRKGIIRDKGCFIVPMKGSKLQISKNSKIFLHGNLYINYYPTYLRGNKQTLIKIDPNGKLIVNDSSEIAYENTISVSSNASLTIDKLFTGVNVNIICSKEITMGHNVMLGRNVCIFDSDYHPVYNDNYERINESSFVIIGNNCWLGANSMVLKGSKIKNGTIVSANTMVMGETEENSIFINKRDKKSVGNNISWKR